MKGLRYKYYIRFSRKAVDDLLSKCDTDKDTVMYYGVIPSDNNIMSPKFRCGDYNYTQFTDLDWETFIDLAKRPEGVTGKRKPIQLQNKGIA